MSLDSITEITMPNLPLEELPTPVLGTLVKSSTPLKEPNIVDIQSPLAMINTPGREHVILQESPLRGSNLSSVEPRKLETSFLSDLSISIQESPKTGSQSYVETPNRILRKLDTNDG